MGFVEHDPFQLAPRGVDDWPVFCANQHVFEHGDVGDKQRRRAGAQPLPVDDRFRRAAAFGFLREALQIPVVEAVPNSSAEGLRPGGEAFALPLYQRVEGIEHDRLHAFERLALPLRLRDQITQDRKEKAFGLSGPSARGDQH